MTFTILDSGEPDFEIVVRESNCLLSITITQGIPSPRAENFDLPDPEPYGDEEEVPECGICLAQFEEGEMIQSVPGCGHRFHHGCLWDWLDGFGDTCPNCRKFIPLIEYYFLLMFCYHVIFFIHRLWCYVEGTDERSPREEVCLCGTRATYDIFW
jgi:hypothetical protein